METQAFVRGFPAPPPYFDCDVFASVHGKSPTYYVRELKYE